MIDILTEIRNRIWMTGEWPTPWAQSLIITLLKRAPAALLALQNYQSSKVMLKFILNRFNPQSEKITAEE